MAIKLLALAVAIVGLTLVACGHMNSGNVMPASGNTFSLPAFAPDLVMTATLPKHTIGEELPSAGLGYIKSSKWKATVGGFTQEERSQTLAFPPGTKITIRNLSRTTAHTLNVIKEISGPPAKFPSNPTLSISRKGGDKLETGYASGPIRPDKSLTVTLVKHGIFLIGCAFHYSYGMRDVIWVAPGVRPGPQATPIKKRGTPPPTAPRSSYAPDSPNQ
jgi:plastocyanin